ncbi:MULTISPECIES: DNA-binding domain-containing protein [unclassified Cupriavidus]|uniref:DNA-binding domain-containing protein n=1 Tax=unclassified Cupriavidus TaxID=2640874 RepID=UPI00313CC2AB
MTLAELQHDFRAWLVDASPDAADRVIGAGHPGLAVYQNNYRAQLVGCLEASYPKTRDRLGHAAFLHTAITHIDARPPHAWTLDAYADGFGDTLATLFPDNPDLEELAWIEHALSTAFVAADAAPLDAADLAALDWDRARLCLSPALRMRAVTTNAERVWHDATEAEMLPEPAALLVWRQDYTSCLRQVSMLEFEALAQLRRDGSFAALCDMLAERLGEDAGVAQAGAWLAGWIGSALIVTTPPEEEPSCP